MALPHVAQGDPHVAAHNDERDAIDAAQSYAVQRANHIGTESADVLTDGTTNKAFLATERTKLAGVAAGATANSPDATLLARANHTGTQLAATISDFSAAADARIASLVNTPTIVYVAASGGSDSNVGTSRGAPFATISAAIAAIVAGSGIGKVVCGIGTHNVAATLLVPQGISIVGEGNPFGNQGATLTWTGADDGSYLVRTASDTSGADATGLILFNFAMTVAAAKPGGGAYTNVNGLYGRNLQNLAECERLWIRNFPGKGVYCDSANGGVPATGFPGYVTFRHVWSTGNIVNWHMGDAGFTSLVFEQCAGDIASQTTDVFIIDPPASGGGANVNYTFIGWKTEQNGTPTGSGADPNLFTVNSDVSISFIGSCVKFGLPNTKPWVKYTVVPSSTNTGPRQIPVTWLNCHSTNVASWLVDSTSTVRYAPLKTTGGISNQRGIWNTELFPLPFSGRLLARDWFNRADSTSVPGNTEYNNLAWGGQGTWGIINKTLYCSASSANAVQVVDVGATDVAIEVQMQVASSGPQRLIVRYADVDNYMYWGSGGSFFKRVAAVETNLGSPGAYVTGDVIKLVVVGSGYWFYKNGVLVGYFSDTSLTAGTRVGVGSNSSAAGRWANLSVVTA